MSEAPEIELSGPKYRVCRERGELLPPCLAVVHGEGEEGWMNIGGGWRKALLILLRDDHAESVASPREGLVATIPQMLAFLHLRYRLIDHVSSTPIFGFQPPLAGKSGGLFGDMRRGIKLLGQPSGVAYMGDDVTIAILYSRESRRVREQLLWA
jgi:hypothetical protein